MKAWLEIQRVSGIDRRKVHALASNEAIGVAEGSCPGCEAFPFYVQGSSPRIRDRDTLQADGHARCCGDAVGYLYAKLDTLFGAEEDRAVLGWGRARVYT